LASNGWGWRNELADSGQHRSLLWRTIAGALAPISGEIRYHGQSIARQPAYQLAQRGIALVPEGRKIFPSLSVAENLKIGAYTNRPGEWNLASVGRLFPILQERAALSGVDLSGGEQQMLAIGRALMSNPELILMDEISLGLAPIVVKELYDVVARIATTGATVILVEQDVSRGMNAADRVYCLLEGKISLTGKPNELTNAQISRAYFGI
jgi:branched-chain amino acid transport system ATP-binding protein